MISDWFRVPADDSGKASDAWFSPGRFAVLLAVFVFALYPDLVVGGRTLVFRDFGLFGYPLAHYHRECFWRGEWPLWNPLNNCGLPFLAQWNTLTLYPLSLFYLVFPLAWSLGVFCLLHLFLAGLGMYFLAHRWTGHRLAACVAGLAFALNGFTLNTLIWPNYIATFGWMPWVLLTAQRAWQEGGRRVIVAALVGALQMLAATPEIILLTWLTVAAIWGVEFLQRGAARGKMLGRLALVVLLVSGLTAAQLLPFLDLLKHSHRDEHFAGESWPMPRTGWANLLVPLFRCYESSSGVYFQFGQGFTSSYYLGIGVLALAVLAVWRVRDGRVRLLGAVAGMCLLLALGTHCFLYNWIKQVFPQIGFMRYPVKFVMLDAFIVPLLAAFAVRDWMLAQPEEQRKTRRCALGIGILFLAGILFIIGYSYFHPFREEVWRMTLQSGVTRAVLLALILAHVAAFARAEKAKRRWQLGLSVLVLIWLDVATHAPRQNPTVERAAFQPGLQPLQQLKPRPQPGESRALLGLHAILALREKILTNAFEGYLCNRLGLYDNCNLLDDLPKVDGFYALYLREEHDVRMNLYPATNAIAPRLADFLSVSQVTAGGAVFDWTARETYLPMATTGQAPVFVDAAGSLRGVIDPDFEPAKTVFLPLEAKPFITVTNRTNAKILAHHFTAQRVTLEVEADAPSLVVLSQVYYHPWKASVDGQATRLWRANHAYQALPVPAGRHEVKLVYDDRNFFYGGLVSCGTLALCLAAWFWLRRGDPGGGVNS